MKATNAPEADSLIRKTYRDGFGIDFDHPESATHAHGYHGPV